MKKHQKVLRSFIVIALLVVYQLLGLAHLAYLPKVAQRPSSIDFLHKNNSTNSQGGQFQRSYHNADYNSRKSLVAPSKTIISFFAFIISGFIMLSTAKDPGNAFAFAQARSPHVLTLRI